MITKNNSPLELEENLWHRWITDKDDQVANELVRNYMHLVTFHVERIAVNLPKNISRDDLESYAFMGLFDALNKFEPERDLKFDTYASFRIRGAIIDGLRKEDWLPRSLREKVKKIESVSQQLEQQLERTPSSEEISQKLGMTSKEVETIINDSLFSNILSIDGYPSQEDSDESENIKYILPDEKTILPDEYMVKQEVQQMLTKEIEMLNKNEQMVISLFYYDELTMTEIGEVLNLTTSRISQIHKSAIFKLRNSLKQLKFSIQT